MESLKDKVLYSAIGAGSSITGLLSYAGCTSGACASCLKCVAAGGGIIMAVLYSRLGNQEEVEDGVA